MAQQVCVVLSAAEREQLAAIVADRNRPRKHVERARIVLASADRHSAQQVAQRIGVSRPTVWRWQQRFAESGVEGLLRDKTRKPGKAPIVAETTARVVALTCTAPPHQATHWTGRAMAKVIGISVGSVQRIWRAHKLQPHRLRTFKRSRDPSFAAKLTDIVGLYVDPPAHRQIVPTMISFGEIPDSHRWDSSPKNQVRTRLAAGGKRIRTLGPPLGDDGCRHTRFDRSGIETVRCSSVLEVP